jgi:hypothetical protein
MISVWLTSGRGARLTAPAVCLAGLLMACSNTHAPRAGMAGGSEPGTAAQDVAAAPENPRTPDRHLRLEGRRFVRPDGETFQWRGISAFQLLEMLHAGREADAVAFLDWAAGQGLTVVRVLTMTHHLFRLAPADGLAALPRLLDLAAERGLFVEIVALADTSEIPVDLAAHVEAVGDVAARHANALVEIANEPVHPTQDTRLHDPETLHRLAALVPDHVPVAYGAADDSDAHARGGYVTVHVSRESGDDGWGHVLALASTAALVERWNKPVVSDEPIGAAQDAQPGRRDNDPARFRAAALLTRLAGLGATFHHEGGLYGRIPAGRELECFDAWNDAWTLLPPGVEHAGTFGPGSAGVVDERGRRERLFHRITGDEAWIVFVGDGTDHLQPLERTTDWTIREHVSRPGATLVHARRTGRD